MEAESVNDWGEARYCDATQGANQNFRQLHKSALAPFPSSVYKAVHSLPSRKMWLGAAGSVPGFCK
jgi:hypothetical protein